MRTLSKICNGAFIGKWQTKAKIFDWALNTPLNFEQNLRIDLVLPLLTLNKKMSAGALEDFLLVSLDLFVFKYFKN